MLILFQIGIILGMGWANESQRCIVASSQIGWAHTQNDDYSGYRLMRDDATL